MVLVSSSTYPLLPITCYWLHIHSGEWYLLLIKCSLSQFWRMETKQVGDGYDEDKDGNRCYSFGLFLIT